MINKLGYVIVKQIGRRCHWQRHFYGNGKLPRTSKKSWGSWHEAEDAAQIIADCYNMDFLPVTKELDEELLLTDEELDDMYQQCQDVDAAQCTPTQWEQ